MLTHHHEYRALYAAVCAEPDDDAPRLVLADWLEENGEDDRAVAIRLSVARSRLDPLDPARWVADRRLSQAVDRRSLDWWRGGLPKFAGVGWGTFDRGFIHEARILDSPALLRHADALFAAAPIDRLSGLLLEDDSLRMMRHLDRVRTIDLGGPGELEPGRLIPLAEADASAGLRELRIADGRYGDDVLTSLAACRGWPNLDTLDLSGNRFTPAGWLMLSDSPLLARLRQLDISNCDGVPPAVGELLESPCVPNLRRLNLKGTGVGAARPMRELVRPEWPSLEALNLAYSGIGPGSAVAFAEGARMPRLLELDLTSNQSLGNRGVAAIAAGDFRGLRSLRLGWCHFGITGLRALTRAAWLPGLARLDLREFRLQVKGCEMLAAAPFDSLRWLDLPACPLGDAELLALLAAPWVNGLTHLILHNNFIGPAGAEALAAPGVLPNVVHLDVSRNPIPPDSLARLRAKFGNTLSA